MKSTNIESQIAKLIGYKQSEISILMIRSNPLHSIYEIETPAETLFTLIDSKGNLSDLIFDNFNEALSHWNILKLSNY